MESKFYELLLELAEIDDPEFQNQMDMSKWPELKKKIETIFKTKTRDEWCEIMEGTDVCFSPVLSFDEAIKHPHNMARNTFVEINGMPHPVPAPRFSRTSPEIKCPSPELGADTESALADWGFNSDEINTLKAEEAI
jgi:alpha-methylacyl-CoA racemase